MQKKPFFNNNRSNNSRTPFNPSNQPRPGGYKPFFNPHYKRTILNDAIKAFEVRVLDEENHNLGVMSRNEALAKAKSEGKDLILITETAEPPVAKIMDYGKFSYNEDKKKKAKREEGDNATETKVLRVSISTGEGDLTVKAKQGSEWLAEGHRIKIELQLKGRANILQHDFLQERLQRILILLTEPYKIAEPVKKIPNGMTMVIEKGKRRE
jgi:translation initiation factor IF-3